MSSLSVLLVVSSAVLGQAGKAKSPELQELAWLAGDWKCQTTLWDDIEGIGKKGDKFEVEATWRWTLNGTTLQESAVSTMDGKVIDRSRLLIKWHPAKKKIVHWWFASVGTVIGQGEWTREGDIWTIKGPIVRSDGTEETGVWIIKKVNDDTYAVGRTHLNGQPEPQRPLDEYKRVKE